jgi:RND superfamily putative drug exporter
VSTLTRWVLAHKRVVVVLWVALAVAGAIAAGPASRALDPEFSVPDKEGWETNVAIAQRYGGTGGRSTPLLPVVTVPRGTRRDSPRRADLAKLDERCTVRCPARGSPRTRRPATARSSRRTAHDVRARLPAAGRRLDVRREPAGRAARRARRSRADGRRRSRSTSRASTRSRRTAAGLGGPACCSRPCIGALGALLGARVRVRVACWRRPARDGVVVDHDHVPAAARLTEVHQVSPIVQFLIALLGLGVAIDYSLLVVSRWREERAHGRERRRGGAAGDGDRRARGRVQRHHRGDRAARADRAAAAVPALDGLRRGC